MDKNDDDDSDNNDDDDSDQDNDDDIDGDHDDDDDDDDDDDASTRSTPSFCTTFQWRISNWATHGIWYFQFDQCHVVRHTSMIAMLAISFFLAT